MTDAAKPRRQAQPRRNARAATEPEQATAPGASPPAGEPRLHDHIDADNLDDAFVKALQADFGVHGDSAIAAMRAEKPTEYIKVIATLRQKGTREAVDPLADMSDADLDRHVRELAQRAGYEIRRVAAPGRDEPAG